MVAVWVWRVRKGWTEVLRWKAQQMKAEREKRILCHRGRCGGPKCKQTGFKKLQKIDIVITFSEVTAFLKK